MTEPSPCVPSSFVLWLRLSLRTGGRRRLVHQTDTFPSTCSSVLLSLHAQRPLSLYQRSDREVLSCCQEGPRTPRLPRTLLRNSHPEACLSGAPTYPMAAAPLGQNSSTCFLQCHQPIASISGSWSKRSLRYLSVH